ncbi:E3 ubiquitin-protein ligase TRIM37-like [Ochlerotatus camptorhynchus]|uniref:E3 ubiquitin-protein ligase TRIM37-like n=1 Tax=Ochlerotatus camptorhynchus TaxID=644619 RepID=UPI0031DB796D
MSLLPVPICFGCAKAAQMAISCSECLQISCGSCFGLKDDDLDSSQARFISLLTARVCPNCTAAQACTSSNIKKEVEVTIEPEPEPPTTVNKVKQERCWSHGKEMNLFCLTCEAIICGDCFLAGAAHMRHQIDFVETVFQEKRVETERKLARLEETVGVLQREAKHCAINLTTIQSAERAVLDEIDAICEEAKQSVNRLTVNRKRKLETRAQFPAKKQKLAATLHKMIDQMPPAEFFQKQSEVYQQCDELIADCAPKGFYALQFEDVGCELVPPYEMQKYTLMNFDGTFAGWPQHLTTSCGTMWNAFLRKKELLCIKVSPYEAEAAKHPYKLLVQLPHPNDISKNLTKTFTIHGPPKEEEIATVEYILEQGFMRKNNELVVKVGLRPLNAITENRFFKNHCRAMKSSITDLEKQVTSSGKDINCKYCIMHFALSLAKTPKKSPEAIHSNDLVDSSERHWCLRVYPFAQTLEETNLKVFVVLRKGTRTKCRYFIELLHDDPKKNVIQCTESAFDTIDAGYGWHCFMERKRLLSDTGFYSSGVLRFRFGVQPLDK